MRYLMDSHALKDNEDLEHTAKVLLESDERNTSLLPTTRSNDLGVSLVVLDDWSVLRVSSFFGRYAPRYRPPHPSTWIG